MLGLGAAVPMALVPATASIMLYQKSAENQQGEFKKFSWRVEGNGNGVGEGNRGGNGNGDG